MGITSINQCNSTNRNNNISFQSRMYGLRRFARTLPVDHQLNLRLAELKADNNSRRIISLHWFSGTNIPRNGRKDLDPTLTLLPSQVNQHILRQKQSSTNRRHVMKPKEKSDSSSIGIYRLKPTQISEVADWLAEILKPESLIQMEKEIIDNLAKK